MDGDRRIEEGRLEARPVPRDRWPPRAHPGADRTEPTVLPRGRDPLPSRGRLLRPGTSDEASSETTGSRIDCRGGKPGHIAGGRETRNPDQPGGEPTARARMRAGTG